MLVVGAGETQEIPGRVHEGIHGVGLAPAFAAAFRTRDRKKASFFSSGLPLPSGTRSTGSTTGNCSSGTGTVPQACNESSESGSPSSAAAKSPNRAGARWSVSRPGPRGQIRRDQHRPPLENPSHRTAPELTQRPCSAYQGAHAFTEYSRPCDIDDRLDRQIDISWQIRNPAHRARARP